MPLPCVTSRRRVLGLAQLLAAMGGLAAGTEPAPPAAARLDIDRVGPPTLFSPLVDRHRFGATNVADPACYPIPDAPVTRETYLAFLEELDLFSVVETPALGLAGPQRFLPVLVQYVQTGDRRQGEAIVAMLRDWHRATLAEVATKGWTEQFIEEPCFIPLYRKYLLAGGLMQEDDAWFRELWLDYCRHLHVWGTKPTEWRGGCHRAVPEALAKGLAALW